MSYEEEQERLLRLWNEVESDFDDESFSESEVNDVEEIHIATDGDYEIDEDENEAEQADNDELVDNELPESDTIIVTFYNFTQGGVDTLDELSANYNVSRNSRRWPLTIFYSLLNTAGVNSQIIFKENNQLAKLKRREYLRELGMQLS